MFTSRALKKVSQLLKIFSKSDYRYRMKLRSWEDFKRISISSREELKAFSGNKLIQGAFNITATSGSTSSRMLIAHSKEAYKTHERRLVRIYRRLGIKNGMVCLNLCSYELNSGGRLMETALKASGAGVIPLGPISSPDKVLEAVHLIKKFRPIVVNAYTNQLFDLFTLLGRKHSIRRCLVNGELLWPDYRRRMEEMGGVSIHDHYGAMEVSGLAVALRPEDEYMKVFPMGLLLEVLEESGKVAQEGVGALLVTDLDNHCMPFIRYRLGDRVELIRRKGSLWIKVLGRTEESLLINGVIVMKHELIRTVNDFISHPHFFFVVDKHGLNYGDKLIINVAGDTPKNFQLLPRIVMKELGLDNCIVVRKHKGDIPRTFNGKIRYFINTRKEQTKI